MVEEKYISEYNEAYLQIVRLHSIWENCGRLMKSGDLIGWKWELERAETELYVDARKLDKDKHTNYLKKLKKINRFIISLEMRFKMTYNPKILARLYLTLKKKELLLRIIQDDAGKGTKYKPFDEDIIY